MKIRMVECEDGRKRQARIYGDPLDKDKLLAAESAGEFDEKLCLSCWGANPEVAKFCCHCGHVFADSPKKKDQDSNAPLEDFTIYKAGVRVKGKHVHGEAWCYLKTDIWYFLSSPKAKNYELLPRVRKRPHVPDAKMVRSPRVRTK